MDADQSHQTSSNRLHLSLVSISSIHTYLSRARTFVKSVLVVMLAEVGFGFSGV